VIREIEVEYYLAISIAEIGRLRRIEEVPATAVGCYTVGHITEGDEHATAVHIYPEDPERERTRRRFDVDVCKMHHRRFTLGGVHEPYRFRVHFVELGAETPRLVIVDVGQAVELFASVLCNRRLGMIPEELISCRAPLTPSSLGCPRGANVGVDLSDATPIVP
jgi:hypothetical protein